jgi:predicted dehydrogenase
MKRIRIILVGLGARAQYWLRVIDMSSDCEVVGLVDPLPAARERASAQLPGVPVAADLGDLIQRVEADAVLLASPPGNRDRQMELAIGARLPILAEKPLADDVAVAARYVAMAERAHVPLMVGLNFRYLPVTQALGRLFADRLGAPEFARFTYERWRDGRLPHLNKYPLSMAQPMLWEQSIHHFDLLRHVYRSEPVQIFARTFNPSWSMYADDANVSALISFANGVIVSYQGTWASNWSRLGFEWRTDCARGIAVQSDQFGGLGYALRDDAALTPVPLPAYEQWIDDAVGLLAAFVGALRNEHELQCSGADHLKSLRMVEACILSSQTGRAINPSDLGQATAEREGGRIGTSSASERETICKG